MGWNLGEQARQLQATYRQRHGYGPVAGPRMRPPTMVPPKPAMGPLTPTRPSDLTQFVKPPSLSQPAPGPSVLQTGIQQAIGGNPQETDPYEAWKAGGRQGNRPAGY